MSVRVRVATIVCLIFAAIGTVVAHANAQTPPFTQCPAVGADPSCKLLIVFNADGSITTYDNSALGPYDGVEDTLVGIENDTSTAITSVNLSSTLTIFGFDSDGLCSFPVSGCPFGSTGYEGPNTSFSNIASDLKSGTLNFPAGLAGGAHTYFSLEEQVGLAGLCVRPSLSITMTSPLPGHRYINNVDHGLTGDGTTIVTGSPITLGVSTSNSSNTAKVDFSIDGLTVGTATTAPFQVTVTPPSALGAHVITATATQIDQPGCAVTTTLPYQNVLCPAGPTITATISKPVVGDLTYNNVDRGPSATGSTLVAGSPVTLGATTSNLANTSRVNFFIDGTLVAATTGPPFEVAVVTPAAGPHLLTATALQLDDPSCTAGASATFTVIDPSAKAVARDVIQNNIPAEVHVLPGGATTQGHSGSQSSTVVDQPLDAASGFAKAFHDTVSISTASRPGAESDAIVANVSLLGGLIQAKTLHAHAKALYSLSPAGGATSDAGTAIEELTVNGTPVAADNPNTTVALPGDLGTIVVHEVIVGGTKTSPEITVNALHAYIHTPAERVEVILGSAYAGANFIDNQFTGPGDLLHQEDDLGTHADAGDAPSKPMPINDGLYGAGFSKGDHADWYAFQAGQGDRIVLTVIPSQRFDATVSTLPVAPGGPADVAPFAAGVVGALGLTPKAVGAEVHLFDPSMVERFRTIANSGIASVIDFNADTPFTGKKTWLVEVNRACACDETDELYTIGLNRSPVNILSDDDASSAEPDDTCATAPALPAAPYSTNSRVVTGGFQNGDTTEAFTFSASQDQHQHILIKADELAGTAIHARLYGPAGCAATPVWEGTLLGFDIGGQNGAGSAQLDFDRVISTTGTYTLVLTRNWNGTLYGAGNYYVSLTQRDLVNGH